MKVLLIFTARKGYDTNLVGNVPVYFNSKLPTIEEIRDAEEDIRNRLEYDYVCVTNIIPLAD